MSMEGKMAELERKEALATTESEREKVQRMKKNLLAEMESIKVETTISFSSSYSGFLASHEYALTAIPQ